MGLVSHAIYFAQHPHQLWIILQWKLWYGPVHKRDKKNEPATERVLFDFLDKTSRSFSFVIDQLHPELRLPICLFYLVLRGLDTIEDDTSIPFATKEPLLRNFQDFLDQDGWTFNGNRPEEKDRQLLVQFDIVIAAFKTLKPAYQSIIKDITSQMGNGMADFIQKAEVEDASINTTEEFDLYCWYAAGVVGEGLTQLILEADMGDKRLLDNAHLYKSMGLFLQKINIIRDVHGDFYDDRRFWPKEIWCQYVETFDDLFKPENIEVAMNCTSHMILNALQHTCDCIIYLQHVKEQSVFNFCAIPQTMALATYELCFRNPAVFQQKIKITKGDALQLMIESSGDIDSIRSIFHRYAVRIQQKNNPLDNNYSAINQICEKIKNSASNITTTQEGGKTLIASKASPGGIFSSPQVAVLGVVFVSILVLVSSSWLMQGSIKVD